MLQYLFSPTKQFTYESGKLLDGGKIYVYIKDTTNLATLYDVDEDYVSNPIILDANGRASVKADDTYEYRLEIYTNRDVLLYTCNAFCDGGDGEGSLSVVRHDETLSGNGTSQSLLGVVNIPLAVDETMTAYTAEVDEKESLVLGVNGDWFNDTFGSALNTKVDWSAFSSCCSAVKGRLDNKLDISAFDLSNYYNKQEINNALDLKLDRSEFYNNISGFQTKLEFGYDENSAISSINNSALAGQGGGDNCPWISGSKVIADTQTLTSNMIIQVISSFDLSGYKNHNIGLKGGTYRFPNEYEIGSALLHTNYFMHLSGMSAYLPQSAFSSYTNYANGRMDSIFQLANSAYTTAVNNFYNKLDASAFSSYSAGQDTIINNITEQITNISNASGNWNDISAYQQNSANYLTAINIPESADWNEATNVVQTNSSNWDNKLDSSAFENASGNFYPMTGNPSGFLTQHQSLEDYYKKTETSSKEEISAAIASIPQGDPEVNNFVQTNSSTIVDVDNVVQTNSGAWGGGAVGDFVPTSAIGYGMIFDDNLRIHPTAISGISIWAPSAENSKFALTAYTANRAQMDKDSYWIDSTYVKNSAFNNSTSYLSGAINYISSVTTPTTDRTFLSGAIDYVSGQVDNKLDTTAFTAWSSTIFSGDYELSAGEGISITDDVANRKTIITNNISAGTNISLVYDSETNKIRIDGEGREYTGVAPINVNNSTNEISITGESLSAGPGIDLFESGGYVVISANGGGVGAGGTSAYYTTGGTSIFEDTMNINSDGVVTLGSYTPGQLVPTTNLTSDEGKFPMIYCRDGRSYYLLERVRQLPYYNAQTKGVLGMSAGSPDWVPMPNCYCVKLNNVTTSIDLANYTAYDKVTVVHSQEGGNDCHLYWDGKTKVIHSASYCELVKVTDGNNNIKWTFTTSGWTNDNWWDWD